MNRYLEYCDRNQKFPVLLVDDGQKLTIEVLEYVLQLNDLSYNNTKFRCALFGEEKLN